MTEKKTVFLVEGGSCPSDIYPVAMFSTRELAEEACALYTEELSKADRAEYYGFAISEIDLDPPLEPSRRLKRWREQRQQKRG